MLLAATMKQALSGQSVRQPFGKVYMCGGWRNLMRSGVSIGGYVRLVFLLFCIYVTIYLLLSSAKGYLQLP